MVCRFYCCRLPPTGLAGTGQRASDPRACQPANPPARLTLSGLPGHHGAAALQSAADLECYRALRAGREEKAKGKHQRQRYPVSSRSALLHLKDVIWHMPGLTNTSGNPSKKQCPLFSWHCLATAATPSAL